MRKLALTNIIAAAFSAAIPSFSAAADSVPMPKAFNSLSTSLSALAASGSEMIQMGRTTQRLQIIRLAFTQRMLVADPSSKIVLEESTLEERALLCEVRSAHVITVSRFGYLNSVATQIQEISKPTNPTDLGSALKALFASYAVKASNASLSPDTIGKLQNDVRTRCNNDIAGFDKAYYGTEIKGPSAPTNAAPTPRDQELAFEFLGPIGALIDTVIGTITPIAIEAATLVDEVKREQAVQAFLSDPKNRSALKDAGGKLAATISQFAWEKRLRLAASVTEGVKGLRSTEINLGALSECKKLGPGRFDRSESGAPSSQFMLCSKAAWEQIEKPISELLKTAEDYDQLADAGNTDTAKKAFEQITGDLTAISENAVTDPTLFWQYVTQLVGFANTIQKSFSQESRDKVHKAIDLMVHTL
jgi:hypothetical protein